MVKLHTMVDTVAWNEENGSLAAIADGHFVVWYYPECVFVDRDLLPSTTLRQPTPDVGRSSELLDFRGTRATVRRSDGAVVTYAASPYHAMVERFVGAAAWESALRLCRYVKSHQLWACLAAMAVAGKELHTAEVAYAAIEAAEKLMFMAHVKELPTPEAREAELLLFRRKRAEAVQVLVQGGWIYRAIKMCIRCFAWEAAYDVARAHATHLDTVLYHRQKYLQETGREETLPKLQALVGSIQVDEEAIKQRVAKEKERELARGGAGA
mmetsp:Transcript_14729/g.43832  ORF Transcript_14729/g.43832 Transcript_14729/m.43832 type:complete len:268 (-) Transcript_14729:97-900(-)